MDTVKNLIIEFTGCPILPRQEVKDIETLKLKIIRQVD